MFWGVALETESLVRAVNVGGMRSVTTYSAREAMQTLDPGESRLLTV